MNRVYYGDDRCQKYCEGCFANHGYCEILKDTHFKKGKCPFYKTKDEYEIQAKKRKKL